VQSLFAWSRNATCRRNRLPQMEIILDFELTWTCFVFKDVFNHGQLQVAIRGFHLCRNVAQMPSSKLYSSRRKACKETLVLCNCSRLKRLELGKRPCNTWLIYSFNEASLFMGASCKSKGKQAFLSFSWFACEVMSRQSAARDRHVPFHIKSLRFRNDEVRNARFLIYGLSSVKSLRGGPPH